MPDAHDAGALPLVAAKTRVPAVHALARERLHQRLTAIWEHGLGLVIAPAGSGKTTLLAQFAERVTDPVAWYRAESSDGDEGTLLAYLEFALGQAFGELDGPWGTVEDAASALERRSPQQRALLIVDDLHVLRGSPAEQLLARLLDYAPPNLAVLLASRSPPGFDVSRLQVAGRLLEVRADDLRFRAWEVERLFRDVYRAHHPPEELAELARRTEGWAAGLQLFHLATRGRRAAERRGVLSGLATRSRFVRDYLASNVLGQLDPRLRRFLVETCVLGRLTGPMCDRYLGRGGSGEVLAGLARSQIFTVEVDHEGAYRYHEVLRSHLSAVLVDEVGESEARRRYVRAGAVLEEAGAVHDALSAYCRGEDWHNVARLLGHEGEQIARDPGEWLDLLPSGIRDNDPWVHLATARRWRAAGRWAKAVAAYRRAEQATDEGRAGDISRSERLVLAAWLEPPLVRLPGWAGILREATVRDPLVARQQAVAGTGSHYRLVAGVSALLAGYVGQARVTLSSLAQEPQASPSLSAVARLAAAAAAMLGGDPAAPEELGESAEDAEALGIPSLARLARALADPGGEGPDPEASGRSFDLETLCRALGSLQGGTVEPAALARAAAGFGEVGAGVAVAWCLALRALALARAGYTDAPGAAHEAEIRARSLAVPGAQALALLALAACQPSHAEAYRQAATALAAECGLWLPPLVDTVAAVESTGRFEAGQAPGTSALSPPAVALRCFGRFALSVDGEAVELGGIRPRVRSLLRLLSLHAGEAVHREVIAEALWPESDPEASTRNLHVAVSTLRHALPSVAGLAVQRDGDAYCLSLPAATTVDVVDFREALATARRARSAGALDLAVGAYQQALAIHSGELLPEEGPADWVVGPRERYRSTAADAAEALAALLFTQGDTAGGALACKTGLEIDRYQDGLWRILIEGLDAAGDAAAAAHARHLYDEVLAELGVSPQAPAET